MTKEDCIIKMKYLQIDIEGADGNTVLGWDEVWKELNELEDRIRNIGREYE